MSAVDNKPLGIKGLSLCSAATFIRPIGDDNIIIKLNAVQIAGITRIIDAVIERHSNHAAVLNHCSVAVDKLRVCRVVIRGNTAFVCAYVEHRAAFTGKVSYILLHKLLHKVDSGRIGDIQSPVRAGAGIANFYIGISKLQLLHGLYDSKHMPRSIEQRNDLYTMLTGIADNVVHIGLRPCSRGCRCFRAELLIAIFNRSCNFISGIVFAVGCQRHIVKQEAQAVVTEGKLDMGIMIFLKLVNNCLNFIRRKILTAAVQQEYSLEFAVAQADTPRLFSIIKGDLRCEHLVLGLLLVTLYGNDGIAGLLGLRFLRRLLRRLRRRFGRLRRLSLLHRLFTHDRLPRLVRKRRHRQQSEHHRQHQKPYKKTLRILTRSGSVHFILFLSLKVRVMASRPSLHKSDNSQYYFTGTYFTAFTM